MFCDHALIKKKLQKMERCRSRHSFSSDMAKRLHDFKSNWKQLTSLFQWSESELNFNCILLHENKQYNNEQIIKYVQGECKDLEKPALNLTVNMKMIT